MTITPLPARPPATPGRPHGHPRRPTVGIRAGEASLALSFEIVLTGESRHALAAEALDGLRRLTDRLGARATGADHDGTAPGGPEKAGPGRAGPPGPDTVTVDPGSRTVVAGARPVDCTRVEFDLLLFLAGHPRRVFTRPQLLQFVWGHGYAGPRTVDVHVRRLRAKVGPVVTTVRSVGYRLADDADVRVVAAP